MDGFIDFIGADGNIIDVNKADKAETDRRVKIYRRLISDLKTVRSQKGISQTQMAKYLGIGQDKVSVYESGKVSPRLDLFLNYLDYLGYTIQIVAKGDDPEKK